MSILHHSAAAVKSTPRRPFGAGILPGEVELDQAETTAVHAARDRAAADARRKGLPAERVEAEAARATREAVAAMATLRRSPRHSAEDEAFWAANSPSNATGFEVTSPRRAPGRGTAARVLEADYRMATTLEDRRRARLERRLDDAAAGRAMTALAAVDAGLLHPELAEAIVERSLVGHRF